MVTVLFASAEHIAVHSQLPPDRSRSAACPAGLCALCGNKYAAAPGRYQLAAKNTFR
jgi:hypothetical protein